MKVPLEKEAGLQCVT